MGPLSCINVSPSCNPYSKILFPAMSALPPPPLPLKPLPSSFIFKRNNLNLRALSDTGYRGASSRRPVFLMAIGIFCSSSSTSTGPEKDRNISALRAIPSESTKPVCKCSSLMPKKIEPSFPLTFGKSAVSVTVNRPSRVGRKGDEIEVIHLKGIEIEKWSAVVFDVYASLPPESVLCPRAPRGRKKSRRGGPRTQRKIEYYAGMYVHVPSIPRGNGSNTMTTNSMFDITELLTDIGAADVDSVVVTLVPGGEMLNIARDWTINIADISIELIT